MRILAGLFTFHAVFNTARKPLAKAAVAALCCLSLHCVAAEPGQVLQQMPAVNVAATAPQPPESDVYVPKVAMSAAIADGVTTGIALAGGAVEMNPMVPTSPLGLIGLTGAKIMLVNYASTLPEQEKRTVLKTTTGLWGGAAANNLLVLLGAPPPIPLFAGAVIGVMAWRHADKKYAESDRLAALQAARKHIGATELPAVTVPVLSPAFAEVLVLDEATAGANEAVVLQ